MLIIKLSRFQLWITLVFEVSRLFSNSFYAARLKGLCRAIFYLFKNLKRVFVSMEFQN